MGGKFQEILNFFLWSLFSLYSVTIFFTFYFLFFLSLFKLYFKAFYLSFILSLVVVFLYILLLKLAFGQVFFSFLFLLILLFISELDTTKAVVYYFLKYFSLYAPLLKVFLPFFQLDTIRAFYFNFS